jgi:Response regulators consisting of a CheY-like receiver domain and a winged-helix DNA-binding domain
MEGTPRKNRILVVDDEKGLVKIIRLNLEHDGFEVFEANNGAQAMDRLRAVIPDLVLLDVMMPDLDGFQVLRMIREVGSTPVIMLTAKGEENDKVRGLELGADDYVTKPFSPRELTSRIRAVLRRGSFSDQTDTGKIDVDGRLQIDFDRHEVWVDGELVQLRPTEYRLLYHLVKNAGWGAHARPDPEQGVGATDMRTNPIMCGCISTICAGKLKRTQPTRATS